MEEEKKRAPNFTNTEKAVLITLVAEFKQIFDCKRKDKASWIAKDDAWEKVTREFNAHAQNSMGSIYRSKETLRKCFENLKHSGKLDVTNEIQYIRDLGECPPLKRHKMDSDLFKEQLLDIMNKKAMYEMKLENNFNDEENVNYNSTDHLYSLSDDNLQNLTEPRITVSGLESPKQDLHTYQEVSKVKIELYKAEIELAKQRKLREEELHNLQKESLLLDIKRKKLEIKRLEQEIMNG